MEEPRLCVLMPEATTGRRVWSLVEKLAKNKIDSRVMLRAVWMEKTDELHPEFMAWFNKSIRTGSFDSFEDLLLTMHREVGLV